MKIKDILEAAGGGYIPKNKKEADDPRYSMAMTKDVTPGEDSRQAAKWGFNVSAGGKVPKLRADGKISEAAMSVGVQGRMPVSPGARGLMRARWRYDKVINSKDVVLNAVNELEDELKNLKMVRLDTVNQLMQDTCEKYRIKPEYLYKNFVDKFNCNPRQYAVKYKKSRIGQPAKI